MSSFLDLYGVFFHYLSSDSATLRACSLCAASCEPLWQRPLVFFATCFWRSTIRRYSEQKASLCSNFRATETSLTFLCCDVDGQQFVALQLLESEHQCHESSHLWKTDKGFCWLANSAFARWLIDPYPLSSVGFKIFDSERAQWKNWRCPNG